MYVLLIIILSKPKNDIFVLKTFIKIFFILEKILIYFILFLNFYLTTWTAMPAATKVQLFAPLRSIIENLPTKEDVHFFAQVILIFYVESLPFCLNIFFCWVIVIFFKHFFTCNLLFVIPLMF